MTYKSYSNRTQLNLGDVNIIIIKHTRLCIFLPSVYYGMYALIIYHFIKFRPKKAKHWGNYGHSALIYEIEMK